MLSNNYSKMSKLRVSNNLHQNEFEPQINRVENGFINIIKYINCFQNKCTNASVNNEYNNKVNRIMETSAKECM